MMPRLVAQRGLMIAAMVLLPCARGWPQAPAPEDQAIETIRQLQQISAADQRRIADWVQVQVNKLVTSPTDGKQAAATTFRKTLKGQFDNQANSPAFRAQLAAQMAQIAAPLFTDPKTDRLTAFALARVLVDFSHIETLPGLLAGLKSSEESVRQLGAKGLAGLKATIVAEKKVAEVVPSLRQAGVSEASPIVLSRIYMALAYPSDLATVFDAYMAIFEKRLSFRRGGSVVADGAEIEAYEFLRTPTVLAALTQPQKEQLVRALAVFLRMDAQRYAVADLGFHEIDRLERSLDAAEAILAELIGAGKGGRIREEIAAGSHDNRAQVLGEANKWVGNPGSNEAGALNAAPWNVPAGAP